MTCIAVTRIKNEADIIEAFVRHHAKYFDHIVVSDDGSTDASFEILKKLRSIGLPLTVLNEPCVGFEQSRLMTSLMRKAFEEFDADWVAPLDADEFIELPPSATLEDILPNEGESPVEVPWSNFAWSRHDEEINELNPVIRLQQRLPALHAMKKIVVPATVGRDQNVILWTGNHGLNLKSVPVPNIKCEPINLCHYPIRSVAQFKRKVIITHLQLLAYFGSKSGLGMQYNEPFELLKNASADDFRYAMEKLSRRYSPPADAPEFEQAPALAPLHYLGGSLEFTTPDQEVLPHVLHYAQAAVEKIFKQARDVR